MKQPLPRHRTDPIADGRKEGVYKAFRAFVIHAANAKSASPWKTSHSAAAVDVLASSREVEQVAIRIVTDRYRKNGWSVTSREAVKVGYDLLCRRGRDVAHVEVKGRAQDGDVVIVTVIGARTAPRAQSDTHLV